MQDLETRIPVRQRTLYVRLGRHLEGEGLRIHAARGPLAESAIGKYYVVHMATGTIVRSNVDLEEYGRELGVLKPYEYVVPDDKEKEGAS
jgi:hypothetical protein